MTLFVIWPCWPPASSCPVLSLLSPFYTNELFEAFHSGPWLLFQCLEPQLHYYPKCFFPLCVWLLISLPWLSSDSPHMTPMEVQLSPKPSPSSRFSYPCLYLAQSLSLSLPFSISPTKPAVTSERRTYLNHLQITSIHIQPELKPQWILIKWKLWRINVVCPHYPS